MNNNDAIAFLRQNLQDRAKLMRKARPNLDWKYSNFEELVLDCGIEIEPLPLPASINRGLPKSCYWNCQQLLEQHPELTYCEGFALAAVDVPLHHAWLIDRDGKAIDPTWETPGEAYLGVPLDSAWVKAFWKERLSRGRDDISIFESNYLEKFSLLKQGLPPEASPGS